MEFHSREMNGWAVCPGIISVIFGFGRGKERGPDELEEGPTMDDGDDYGF